MSDTTDGFRDLKAVRQFERQEQREAAPQQLRDAGLTFRSHNDGAHLVIVAAGRQFDFWPGTGRWKLRGDKRSRHGIESLIKSAMGEKPCLGRN